MTVVSKIYLVRDAKRSATYAYNVKTGCIVQIKKFSTEAEAKKNHKQDVANAN